MAKEVKKQHHQRHEAADSKAPAVVEETPVAKEETSNHGEIEITCMSSMLICIVR